MATGEIGARTTLAPLEVESAPSRLTQRVPRLVVALSAACSLFGVVVWRCNNFKDIEFTKYELSEPNLFQKEEDDYEIPLFLNQNKKETA